MACCETADVLEQIGDAEDFLPQVGRQRICILITNYEGLQTARSEGTVLVMSSALPKQGSLGMTLGDSYAESSIPWLTHSGAFLKDSDTESVTGSMACEEIPTHNLLFPAQYTQLKSCLYFTCKTLLQRGHVGFTNTHSQVSNSGIVPRTRFHITSSHLITDNLAGRREEAA